MSSFTVKSISFLWLLLGYSLVTRWLFVTIKHIQSLVLNKSSVFFRMTLIHHAHSSKFMEWHNLGITTLTHLTMSFPEKNWWKFWNGLLCREKSDSSTYSMLQHIGRVATPKITPRNFLRYLQTTLIIGRRENGPRLSVRYCGLVKKKMFGVKFLNVWCKVYRVCSKIFFNLV